MSYGTFRPYYAYTGDVSNSKAERIGLGNCSCFILGIRSGWSISTFGKLVKLAAQIKRTLAPTFHQR